ncbi:MAG: DUF4870 domain-containing protein [Candidatus Woesearchaeota archaeon]
MADKTMLSLVHILAYFSGFLGPLIVYLVVEDADVKKHARTALNWQISFIVYAIISFILVFLLVGILLLVILFVLDLVFCIKAAMKASNGALWKYPLSIGFVK